jgi:hypothetical protein
MVTTDEGIQIDFSDEQPENAPSARFETWHPVANVTLERLVHAEKQDPARISTDEGIQIDSNDEQ